MSPKKVPQNWPIKAYNNHEFLNSPSARTLRVMSEMIEPRERLRRHKIHNTVVFFGSARTLPRKEALKRIRSIETKLQKNKNSRKLKEQLIVAKNNLAASKYYEDAVALSAKFTKWFNQPKMKKSNYHVCTGGGPGIMAAANQGAQKAGGDSIGLNINLPMEQEPNPYQTKEKSFEFHYFFIRKFWFFYLAKGMIVFPGGFGTFDEFFELLTIIQTEKTKKYMPIVLYGKEFWNEVVNFDALVKWGMISPSDLHLFKICDDVDTAYTYIQEELTRHHLA